MVSPKSSILGFDIMHCRLSVGDTITVCSDDLLLVHFENLFSILKIMLTEHRVSRGGDSVGCGWTFSLLFVLFGNIRSTLNIILTEHTVSPSGRPFGPWVEVVFLFV